MSAERTAPRGTEWGAVNDVLHALANMLTVRSHYTVGHPAINQADDNAAAGFGRVLELLPDLVVALVDGEFIVCERPLPDLRARLHVLADAMTRHGIECLVFQRGMTREECGVLGSALAQPADAPDRVREHTQAALMHVLLRFVVRAGDSAAGAGTQNAFFVSPVHDALVGVARALAAETPIDKLGLLAIANQIVLACSARTAMINQRSWTRSMDDEATHATNVAIMTALLALDAGYPQRVCIDATAGALLHDIGHLFLPDEIRGTPEPLLDERAKPVFRNHTFAGAQMLLGAGCSPMWVAAAFEHHRGVDSAGYPTLESKDPPHELVRMIALANYFDSKRTKINAHASEPDEALRDAMGLEQRYFGEGLVRRFLRVIGVFPAGTTVELSSLEPAIVTRANATDPWRPQVRILRGPNVGRLVDLREMDAREVRHRLSVVRAIAPPLLVLADVAVAAPAPPPRIEIAQEDFAPQRPAPLPETAARDAQDRARASLGGMDAMLDALLTVPTEALVSAMPPAPSNYPRAGMTASIPPYAAAPQFSSPPPARTVPPAPAPMPSPPPSAAPPRMTRPPTGAGFSPASRPPPAAPSRRPPPIVITSPPPQRAPGPAKSPPIVVTRPPPAPARVSSPPAPMQRPSARSLPPLAPSVPPGEGVSTEAEIMARLGSASAVPVLVADVTKLNLDHRAAFVLRFLDGMSSVDDVLDASGLPRIDALRILDSLLGARVIAMK